MSNERAPLCPAGHLPHKGGERRVVILAAAAGVELGEKICGFAFAEMK